MEKLVLIDGNSLINRAFYAMPPLITKDGTPTNAVYGFMNMFFKMLSDVNPTFVAVAFDLKAPTFRHKMYDGYKATRKPMPDDLRTQIPLLKELLGLMGVACFEKEGVEADDIIGTIAHHTSVQTFIYTGDRDSFQLVDNETTVCFTRRGITDVDILDVNNFEEKTGISPIQIIDLKSLMGDASDNIPGVAGIGEKTALTLIQTYKNIDNLYASIDDVKGKLKEKLILGKNSAYLSKTLATIDIDCDVDIDVEKMRIPKLFPQAVKQRFSELEFKSLSRRDELFCNKDDELGAIVNNRAETIKIKNLSDADSLFGLSKISLVKTDDSVSLSDGKNEYTFPVKRSLLDEGFTETEALNYLKPIFNGTTTLILYDKKAFRHFLKTNLSIDLTCPTEDVSLMKYLADYSGRAETLKEVIDDYTAEIETPAYSLYQIYLKLLEETKKEDVYSLYKDLELPLSDVLYDMERSGFKVDAEALKRLSKKYQEYLTETEAKIRELADEPLLNVNSPKQLGAVLFEKLKIGKAKKTKTGYSTNAEVLEALEDAHPIVKLILDYRKIQKLRSTYVEGFKDVIEKNTGLIHTSFNQTVTATGRLSSKEPNLQNIPIRDDEGKELRKFFVPKSGDRILVTADYSQIELRLLAAFSDCKPLMKAFQNNQDVHAETASKVFGVPISQVTPQMRRNAKAVNFGIIYGISEFGLAKNIKSTNAEARRYIAQYFQEFPEVKKYMEKNVDFAKEHGYVSTMLGRKRYIRELKSTNHITRSFGERVAMNMPLQGSAADIIKIAMLGVHKRLKAENLKSELILQIHDELIIDTFITEKDQVIKILTEEMEGAVSLSVPLTASVGVGETWYDAK